MPIILPILLICLFYFPSVYANRDNDLPITGVWKVLSYQIVGYPAMDEAEINKWIGRQVEFTSRRAILREGNSREVCQEFSFQVSTQTAEGYFLVGYKVKPNRFGITQSEVEVITMTCKTESWLGAKREFVRISNDELLSNWDGVFFFFYKQSEGMNPLGSAKSEGMKVLLITPQSVGLITPRTSFNKEVLIQVLGGGYKVKEISHLDDDKKVILNSLQFFRKDKLMLEIYPDENGQKVKNIKIFDETAKAPSDAKIGSLYSQVFNLKEQLIDCQAGIGERSGQTLCSFKDMSMIKYIFKPIEDEAGKISPIEALNQAKLVEFIWEAEPSLMMESNGPLPPPEPVKVAMPMGMESQDSKRQEEHLNELFNLLKELLAKEGEGAPNLEQFLHAQQAWLEYRDKNCSVPNDVFNCQETMTRKRVEELEQLLKAIKKK